MEDIIDIIVTETTNLIEITSQPTDEVIDVNIIDNREDITLNVTPSVVEININSLTGNFGVNWGDITGTISNQTDLNTALSLKADLVDGKVPSSQLPSYVDDIVEVANYASLPATGEVGKIYITLDTNFIYRWTGSTYVEIKDSSAVWGAITGTLSNQTDLQNALNLKANDNAVVHNTGNETIAGQKTFTGEVISTIQLTSPTIKVQNSGNASLYSLLLTNSSGIRNVYLPDADGTIALTSNLHNPVTLGTANGLSLSTQVLSLGLASSSANGALSSTDWTTFNNKLSTATAAATYLALTGGTLTGTLIGTRAEFTTSTLVDGVLVNNGSGRGIRIVNAGAGYGLIINNETASSAIPFVIQKSGLDKIYFTDSGAGNFNSSLTASSFVKSGGTSAQYLMADGSVSTLTNPVTGTGTSGIVAKFNGTSSVTDSIIYDNGTRVSIGADVTTSNKFTAVASTTSSYAVVAQASGAANGFWATLSGSGEIFRGQTSGGSYFIINNGGNAFLNGNLNVGDFASTSYKLKVNGTANFTDDVTFDGGIGAINFSASTTITNTASSGYTAIYANGGGIYLGGSASTNHLTITSGGNVGIGTTSPVNYGSSYTVLNVYNPTSGGYFVASAAGGGTLQLGMETTVAWIGTTTGHPVLFQTGASERMRIRADGLLDYKGAATTTNAQFVLENTNSSVNFYSSNTSGVGKTFVFYTSGLERLQIAANGQLQIKQSGNTYSDGLRITNTSGNYWSITHGGDNSLYLGYNVADRGVFNTSTGIYTPLSDRNKKKDFEVSNIGLNEVLQLNPTLYRMKTDSETSEKQLGFIAQDVKGIIPSAYVESGSFIGLNFNPIVAAAIKAIQELKAELDTLKNK